MSFRSVFSIGWSELVLQRVSNDAGAKRLVNSVQFESLLNGSTCEDSQAELSNPSQITEVPSRLRMPFTLRSPVGSGYMCFAS